MNFLNSKWNYFLQNGISSSEMGFLFLKSRFFLRNGFLSPEMLFLSQKWYFQQKSYNRYVTLYYLESAFWLQYVLIPGINFLALRKPFYFYLPKHAQIIFLFSLFLLPGRDFLRIGSKRGQLFFSSEMEFLPSKGNFFLRKGMFFLWNA